MPWPRWTGASLQTGWRTLVPLVVGGTVALVLAGTLTAGASDAPPRRTAAELLAGLDRVDVAGYSGTVVQKSTLLDDVPAGATGLSLARLMSGSNTIKVWYGGEDRQRIAVLDATGESDLFRDGDQVWQWDSTKRVAVQSVANQSDVEQAPIPVDGTTVTPDDLARQTVAAIDPDTEVRVAAPGRVAGRSAYQLVLTPSEASGTRIGRVVLWLDGDTRMPLAAQVFARGITREPSIDLSFTQIAFEVPEDEAFRFVPPRGASIKTYNSAGGDADIASSPDPLLGLRRTTTTGTSWTRVAVITPPNTSDESRTATTAQFGDRLTAVSGAWGSGKLLETDNGLLTMLFVSDGRIVVGAVAPDALYAALG